MKCHLLGTGGSVNSLTRHNTSFFLENGPDMARDCVMIDCNGAAVQRVSAAGLGFEDLAHIFLTHEHIDHIAALPNFIHQSWVKGCLYRAQNRRTHALNIYANARTIKTVRALIDAVNLPGHPHMFPFAFHELDDAGGTVTAGSITLTYFPVNHGPTPCFGLMTDGPTRRLVYSADTEPVQAIYDHLRDGDILIHDCNKVDVDVNPEHTTWAQIDALIPSLPDVTVYLVHLPLMCAEHETAFMNAVSKKYGDRVVVGVDGESILL